MTKPGVALTATAMLLVGCEGDPLTIGQPRLTLSPEPGVLTWGLIGLDAPPERKIIQIGNSGVVRLTIADVTLTGPDRGLFTVSAAPDALAPGQTAELTIALTPPHASTIVAAELRLTTDDPDRPVVTYQLTATVQPRCALRAEPGIVETAVGASRPISVVASAAAPCRLVRVAVDERFFRLTPGFTADVELAPGEVWTSRIEQLAVGIPQTSRSVRFIASEGPGARTQLVPEEGPTDCLSFVPQSVIFATPLLVGESSTRTVSIVNSCDVPIEIFSASAGAAVFSIESWPDEVPADDRVPLEITFTPHIEGEHRSQLMVRSADVGRPQLYATLVGEAEVETVYVRPPALAFGDTLFQAPRGPDGASSCGSAVRSVSILNATGQTIAVGDLLVTGEPRFAIIGATIDGMAVSPFRLSVPARTEATVDLRFYPSRASPRTHTATLTAPIAGQDTARVRLLGATAEPGVREERFRQSSAPRTDVLFVVDQSGSMRQERARLERNLGTFLAQAARTDSDLRIGLTTADSRTHEAGRLHHCSGHPPFVDASYADADTRSEALTCALTTLPRGSPVEGGLGAAVAALDPVSGVNPGFVRSDANLSVIIVSDEDDQSVGTDAELLAALRSTKPQAAGVEVKLHAIVGDPSRPGCPQALPAPRYARFADALGGEVRSICLEDWNPILQAIGRAVVATRNRFPLAHQADPTSIVVTVGGAEIAPDSQDGFTYDRQRNSVLLNGAATPEPGTEVAVRYELACDP